MTVSKRTYHKDPETEKKFEIRQSKQELWHIEVLIFRYFELFLVTK